MNTIWRRAREGRKSWREEEEIERKKRRQTYEEHERLCELRLVRSCEHDLVAIRIGSAPVYDACRSVSAQREDHIHDAVVHRTSVE